MWQELGRMRQIAGIAALVAVGLVVFAVDSSESVAEAKYLKHGVRVGDRSKMTIRRVPPRGARKRVFHPGERRAVPEPGTNAVNRRKERHAWFWKIHSAAASAASRERFAAALTTLQTRRRAGKAVRDAKTLAAIAISWRKEIAEAARTHRISEALLMAVIAVESRGVVKATSSKGAQGLMQLIPATAKRFGVTDSFDAAQNISGGAAYLSWLLKTFDGDPLLALAGYNAGEGAVRKHKGVPPFAETRDYIVLVFDALAAAQAFCAEPLTGPRQRCIAPGASG